MIRKKDPIPPGAAEVVAADVLRNGPGGAEEPADTDPDDTLENPPRARSRFEPRLPSEELLRVEHLRRQRDGLPGHLIGEDAADAAAAGRSVGLEAARYYTPPPPSAPTGEGERRTGQGKGTPDGEHPQKASRSS